MPFRPDITLRLLLTTTVYLIALQVSACGPTKGGDDSDQRDAGGLGGDAGAGGTTHRDGGTGGTTDGSGGVDSTGGATDGSGGVDNTGGTRRGTGGTTGGTGGATGGTGGVDSAGGTAGGTGGVDSAGGTTGGMGGVDSTGGTPGADAAVLGQDGDGCESDGECAAGLGCCAEICRASCGPPCGNGRPDDGEQCDLGADNSNTGTCKLDCTDQMCGDGHRGPTEACDEGPQNSDAPNASCRTNCQLPRCGDDIVDDTEECDDGEQNSDTTADACRTDCRAFRCGDRQLDTGEVCDDGNDVELDGCSSRCTTSSYRLLPTLARTDSAWVDVAVSPHGSQLIYGLDERGMVYVSDDGGQTNHRLCVASTFGAGEILLSAAADRTVYVLGAYLYQVEPMAGGPCRRLPIGADDNGVVSVAIAPSSGDLHVWDDAFLWSVSSDRGRTWTGLDHGMVSTGSEYVSAVVDPSDDENIFLVREDSGLYHRTAASGTFAAVPTGTFAAGGDRVRFDPVTSGLLYSGAGFVSTDGGETWGADGAYTMSGDWTLDGAGRGYRLVAGATSTVLERANDMAAPGWVAIATFAGTSRRDRVSAFGNTLAVIVDNGLHISVDDGQSFTPSWHYTQFEPVTISSVDGQTLHAATSDWGFYRSSNAGASWTSTFQAPDPREDPEILVNPADPRHVFVHATSTSVYERQIVVSHDGMDTAVTSEDGVYGWATTVGQSLTNPNLLYNIGWMEARRSLDAGDTYSPIALSFPLVWYPSQAIVSPVDDDVLWVADRGVLYEYQHGAGTFEDVSSRLGPAFDSDSVAGLQVLDMGLGSYRVLAIGAQGALAVSDDLTQTFSAVGVATGSCSYWRLLEVAPGNADFLATACYGSNRGVAVSTDGGSSWVDLTQSPDWSLTSCTVLDLTMTQTNAIFACSGKAALVVPLAPAICGNGQVELPEACDEGSGANSEAPGATCRTDCTVGRCGDGVQDAGEQCDDGNDDDTDGCTSDCRLCGNQEVSVPESCDEGPGNSAAPDATCRLDCRWARCGDGTVDSDEVCDDGNILGGDGCRADCMGLEDCGDGLRDYDAGEECDLGDENSDSAVDGCRTSCLAAYCGDGIVDTGETCEGGNECSANCLADYLVEPLCDGLNDDDDQVVDEGCAGTPPSTPLAGWVPFDFAYYDYRIGCTGQRYVAETGYTNTPFVGVILCSDSRYKIMLSESLDGTFYSIGDGAGSGQDHCEFVGGTFAAMDSSNNGGEPGFRRSSEGDEPTFGTMGGAHYTATWYECGVTIP